jgi:hypothetical protein
MYQVNKRARNEKQGLADVEGGADELQGSTLL